jgi:LacI family transcriptional regulator
MPGRVTIADVAREAGVSLMTVSRALNNKDGVNAATRSRILEIVERLGYRPSGVARSLVQGRTGTIGLIVPDISNPYFSGIAHGVSNAASEANLSVLLCNTEERAEREIDFISVLEEKGVDGLIMAAPRQDTDCLVPLLARHQNVVIINRFFDMDGLSVAGYVVNNDREGGYCAARHLISRGHQAIGFLAGPANSYGSKRRLEGYRQAHNEAYLTLLDETVVHCPPSAAAGREAALNLFHAHPQLTALFCFNDMVAIGALQACRETGRHVPEDMAIVGYDDVPMALWVTPPLTTLRAPFENMGRLATTQLIQRMHNCTEGCDRVVLTPELIVRASAP